MTRLALEYTFRVDLTINNQSLGEQRVTLGKKSLTFLSASSILTSSRLT